MEISMVNEGKEKKISSGFLSITSLRDFVIVLVLGIVAWKLAVSDIQIDMSKFSFSELLALLLSLFSVALSVAFYFKADETSSQFYNNSYKFTKDISEILGRMEAGFGERLRHLDEGYSRQLDRALVPPTNAEITKNEEELEKRKDEQQELIKTLIDKAELAVAEKEDFLIKLNDANRKLETAQIELMQHKSEAVNATSKNRKVKKDILSFLARRISRDLPSNGSITMIDINNAFRRVFGSLSVEAIEDLRHLGLLDADNYLTAEGVHGVMQEM
jgi:hypothetical protein